MTLWSPENWKWKTGKMEMLEKVKNMKKIENTLSDSHIIHKSPGIYEGRMAKRKSKMQ